MYSFSQSKLNTVIHINILLYEYKWEERAHNTHNRLCKQRFSRQSQYRWINCNRFICKILYLSFSCAKSKLNVCKWRKCRKINNKKNPTQKHSKPKTRFAWRKCKLSQYFKKVYSTWTRITLAKFIDKLLSRDRFTCFSSFLHIHICAGERPRFIFQLWWCNIWSLHFISS